MFSFHEVGVRDLPVMIDYVLSYTKQKTLCYVGYSLGTTELFVLLSMKPEYNAKIKLGVLLGSSAIWKEMSPTVKYICSLTPMIKVNRHQNIILNETKVYFISSVLTLSYDLEASPPNLYTAVKTRVKVDCK